MNGLRPFLINSPAKAVRNPGFWFIVVLFVLITLPHYEEALKHPTFLSNITATLGLTRHTFERILYLAPIVWTAFLFGRKEAIIASLAALACMLPRAIILSTTPTDAIFESFAVFVIGNALAITFNSLHKERVHRTQLEITQQELRASEQRYRELFENAHDAILVQDLGGNIQFANRSAEKLTGYRLEELTKMNVTRFLSDKSLDMARETRHKLLNNEPVEQPYQQRLIRKDGSYAILHLSTSVLMENGEPRAFQHIARDVTEQQRLQENLRFFSQQATKAQEEERKRISRELHDETIQELVVLSRQLDALASSGKGLSPKNSLLLENLRQQTNNIMKGVRRLSQDLRPAALDRLGLLPTLEWLASDISEYSGISTKINVLGTGRRLPEEVELMLFRITQEALRNVWRHSQATEAEITVEFEPSKTKITIRDNGKGFSLPKTIGDLARDGKLGLAGMQERAQLLGGTLTAQSQPGKGTSITVELPV